MNRQAVSRVAAAICLIALLAYVCFLETGDALTPLVGCIALSAVLVGYVIRNYLLWVGSEWNFYP
ncbi:MAG: hypothetical protein ACREEL_08515 [Stellaceae bacterium]